MIELIVQLLSISDEFESENINIAKGINEIPLSIKKALWQLKRR